MYKYRTVNFYSLLVRYGPMIQHWTARYEAKHRYFKRLANVIGNFTNISYSLALRHQLYQCYLSMDYQPRAQEVGPGM